MRKPGAEKDKRVKRKRHQSIGWKYCRYDRSRLSRENLEWRKFAQKLASERGRSAEIETRLNKANWVDLWVDLGKVEEADDFKWWIVWWQIVICGREKRERERSGEIVYLERSIWPPGQHCLDCWSKCSITKSNLRYAVARRLRRIDRLD